MEATTTCPGCGLELTLCRARYDELSAYHLTRIDPDFHHQIAVDCYCAQHAGAESKPIGIVFSLVGLCLLLEHGYNGRRIQLAHMQLSYEKNNWPHLQPRGRIVGFTVDDVMRQEEGDARDIALYDWAAHVWNGWRHEHERIRNLCTQYITNV